MTEVRTPGKPCAGMAATLGPAMLAAVLLAGLASGCAKEVDVASLPARYSIAGYNDATSPWYSVDVAGKAPGHGDTYRRIFVNDVGQSYSHAGEYPIGTLLVKEIYKLDKDSQPGELNYIAVMRKIARADVPEGIELDDGWLFTFLEKAGDDAEFTFPSCYAHCHVQAPLDSVWYDYGL